MFWTGGKNSLDCLEKKYGNTGWYFCSFLDFYWKFDNKQSYQSYAQMKCVYLFICKTLQSVDLGDKLKYLPNSEESIFETGRLLKMNFT